jgi:hypothetical protein
MEQERRGICFVGDARMDRKHKSVPTRESASIERLVALLKSRTDLVTVHNCFFQED